MHPRYPHVFSPIRLGPVEIPTRFFFAPHGSSLSAGTKPSDDLVAYSVERVSDGGCGLVIVALVQHERGRTQQPSPHPPENIAAFRVMADAIHEAGGKIFGQIFYWWGGYGRWQPFSPPGPAFGPSVRQFSFSGRGVATRPLAIDDIQAMHEAARQSARHLREAGFDGIMLHGSHAGLIEQFSSPYFNERDDEYGGSPENRLRFAIENLTAVREGAGPDMAVGMRINCDEQIAGGYDSEGARDIVESLCQRGLLDFVDLDVGLEPQQFQHGMPPGFERKHYYRPFVASVRKAAGHVPVLSVLGRLNTLAEAEEAIASGVIDMAGAARQLIAEPRLVQNARRGEEARSRICIACNWCVAAMGDGAMGCTINPASYRERLWGVGSFARAAKPAKVVVVGGGPGGLEAARVSAIKGHDVTLFEARDQLGGALALWAGLPGRAHYGQAVSWWRHELERLGVRIHLNAEGRADAILALGPDAVIVATGARYTRGGRSAVMDADIPGSDADFVFRPEEILQHGARPEGRVLVADAEGYHTGSGIAELLAHQGAEVEFLFPGYAPLSPRLIDNWEDRYIIRRLKENGVRLHPSTWIDGIGHQEATLRDLHTGELRTVAADAIVLVAGKYPCDDLAQQLSGKVGQLFTIGDALAPRMLAAATYEGQKFAREIGEPDGVASVSDAWFKADAPDVMPLPADIPRQSRRA